MSYAGYFGADSNNDPSSPWSTIQPCQVWPKDVYPVWVRLFQVQVRIPFIWIELFAPTDSCLVWGALGNCFIWMYIVNINRCYDTIASSWSI
jgi:hypothetical protein